MSVFSRLALCGLLLILALAPGCSRSQSAPDKKSPAPAAAPAATDTPGITEALPTTTMSCADAFGAMPQLLPQFIGGAAFDPAAPVATLYGDDRRNAYFVLPQSRGLCARETMTWTTWEQRYWAQRFSSLKPAVRDARCGPLAIAWGKSQPAWLVEHLGQIGMRMGCRRLDITMVGIKHKTLLGHDLVLCPPVAADKPPCGLSPVMLSLRLAGTGIEGSAEAAPLPRLDAPSFDDLENELPRWIGAAVSKNATGTVTIVTGGDVEWFRVAMVVDTLLDRAPGLSLYLAAAMR